MTSRLTAKLELDLRRARENTIFHVLLRCLLLTVPMIAVSVVTTWLLPVLVMAAAFSLTVKQQLAVGF